MLVIEKEEDTFAERISTWGKAKKVSVWGNGIRKIDGTPPTCSQLETLIVRNTQVSFMPEGFFDSMTTSLTVLDLSENSNIRSFPEEICNLIMLQHLNLSRTSIEKLPEKIQNLTRLRLLLLDDVFSFSLTIPSKEIASLPLMVFSTWRSMLINEEEKVEELGRMQHLTDLSILLCKSSSVLKIFQSPNLRRHIRRAWINYCEGLTSIEISGDSPGGGGGGGGGFSHLEELRLVNCDALRKMEIARGGGRARISSCFPSLVRVGIIECGHLEDLSWLVHAPNLWELQVRGCGSIERIIGDGFTGEELAASGLFSRLHTLVVSDCESMERMIGDGYTSEELAALGLFSRLQTLHLDGLRKLRSICDQTLSFPQRVAFHIYNCPGLRQLPLDSNSARASGRSFQVYADGNWWVRFEWDPVARVTLHLEENSVGEEMTFGKAIRKVKDEGILDTWRGGWASMEFGP